MPEQADRTSIKDKYDYVMHGKIYKTELDAKKIMNIYASFGGLLMKISGNEE